MTGNGGAFGLATPRATSRAADEDLLDRAARGQPEAFDALIRPRLDRLYRLAITITRSEPDARDAVQEACVLAWRELPRLRDPRQFDSWLSQILVNACRMLLRRQRRVRVREVEVDDQADAGREAFAGYETRPLGDQVAEVEAIRLAFERLDPQTRALLAMHYVEERPLAEIARVLGSPVGTVKWRLSNARRALDRALEVERR
jgi:RNA polymerase sigma-70 factor (ECF subfamily)